MIVVLWTLFAFLGLVVALLARHNAKAELLALGDERNGRERLGRSHVRDETIVAVIDFTWFIIGLVYLVRGQEVTNPLAAIPLVASSALLALSTFKRWRDRVAVMSTGHSWETTTQREDRLAGVDRRAVDNPALARQDEQDQLVGDERRRLQALDRKESADG